MEIRRATVGDLPAVMDILRRLIPGMRASGNLQWDHDYPDAAAFERDLELGELWVAAEAERVAGVAAITTDQPPEYQDAGCDTSEAAVVVHRLAVDGDFQGRGVAGALLEQAETVAGERGIGVMRVDTNLVNAGAQRLFGRLGYRLAGEIRLAFRPGLRVVCFEKRLRV